MGKRLSYVVSQRCMSQPYLIPIAWCFSVDLSMQRNHGTAFLGLCSSREHTARLMFELTEVHNRDTGAQGWPIHSEPRLLHRVPISQLVCQMKGVSGRMGLSAG